MKLNFKDWSIIYEALTAKAETVASELKWHVDWHNEHAPEEEEDQTTKELRAKLEALTSIIRKLENSAI